MARRLSARWRRWLSRLAIALGLLLLVAAPVLRFWVTPALAQSPQVPGNGSFLTFTSTGTVSALFDLATETDISTTEPIPVTRTLATTGSAEAAQAAQSEGLNVAVTETLDQTVTDDDRVIAQTQFRLAADRHSQALADCCGVQVGGVSVPMAGAGNPLRLPWFAAPETYPYFDTTLLKAVDLSYIGTEQVGDVHAMKFQQATPPTVVGTVPVPGDLVGSEQPTVTLGRAYSVTRSLWVDPTTGIVLRSTERVREALRDDAGQDVVVLLVMTLSSTPEQQAVQLAAAHQEGQPVLWAYSYGPALCLAVGGVLLVLGLIGVAAAVRARRLEQDFPDELATFDDLRQVFE